MTYLLIAYPSVIDEANNIRYAFVEYENHKSAAMARCTLIPGRIQLWGHRIAVDWAEPERQVDEALCQRNLMLDTTEDTVRYCHFNHAINSVNAVKRVSKNIRNYAFVHFHERVKAMVALKKILINITINATSCIELNQGDSNEFHKFISSVNYHEPNPHEECLSMKPEYSQSQRNQWNSLIMNKNVMMNSSKIKIGYYFETDKEEYNDIPTGVDISRDYNQASNVSSDSLIKMRAQWTGELKQPILANIIYSIEKVVVAEAACDSLVAMLPKLSNDVVDSKRLDQLNTLAIQ
ncbi:RNA-binding protein 47 [Schistosoma japonicum]|nr:RNA-binding protein 47 [Schistosoma japonicum]